MTIGIKFANFAFSTLAVGCNTTATSLALASGTGAKFPTLAAGEYFYATLENASLDREVVKVTARSTDTITVVRGQDNTTARSWNAGDSIALRLNAGALDDFKTEVVDATNLIRTSNNTFTGTNTFSTAPTFGTPLAIASGGTGASTAATAFDNLKQAATNAYAGTVELATDAEAQIGTDTARALTPANLRAANIVSGTVVATTSGTSVDFIGLPSWAKRITVLLRGVSTTGSSVVQIQLGTLSGVETTGYDGNVIASTSAGYYTNGSTSGFPMSGTTPATAANLLTGVIQLTRLDELTWLISGNMMSSSYLTATVSGSKVLVNGFLDRVRITTVSGTATFDAGSANILWE